MQWSKAEIDRVRKFEHPRVLVMDDERGDSRTDFAIARHPRLPGDGGGRWAGSNQILRAGFASREKFQAVILDATIRGGLGGMATIERLRGLDPEVNAIICSGYSDEAALSEFLAYGFRGALPKPFTRGELADALQRTLPRPDEGH